MNDKDIEFEVARTIYELYLKCHEEATIEQSRLADNIYNFILETQKGCDLYKDSKIEKPENHIRKLVKEGERNELGK